MQQHGERFTPSEALIAMSEQQTNFYTSAQS